jgi:endoglucanase
MLILALMADHDPDARRLFDAMLAYRDDHPAASNPNLMAWNQIDGCVDAGADVGGDHSATDGDLDIAFALLAAAQRWPDGPIDYKARALAVLDATLAEVKGNGDFLTIGDWAQSDETYLSTTRTSDFMPSHFRAFADASGNAVWLKIIDQTYGALDAAGSDETGLVPDFILGMPDAPKPVPAGFLEGEGDGALSWNAVRVPWRLALDYLLYGEPRAHARLLKLNAFIRNATAEDPTAIRDGYALNGVALNPEWEGGLAWQSMFAVAAMSDPSAQDWLDALFAAMVATPLEQSDYYGNTLKLLALMAMEGWPKL